MEPMSTPKAPNTLATEKEETGKKAEMGAMSEQEILDEKRIIRRVDLRMLPLLGLLYSVSLIDRFSLGSARVAGMDASLGLSTGARYTIVTCLYFVPYILLQIPANIVLRVVGARTWLTFIIFSWGTVMMGTAFVTNWILLAFCRVLLGTFEAGFFPALVFITTTWYKRHEVQTRLACFYLLSYAIAGFSSILAYLISLLHGKRGIAGWSWIFLIEGAFTIFLSILCWLFVPDFPDRNTFLTAAETQFVLRRIEEDRGDSVPDSISFEKVLMHLGDWTIWAYGLCDAASTIPAYMVVFFAPTIIQGMGWKGAESILLTAPLSIPATLSAFFFSWLSDRSQQRALCTAIQALITIAGVAITAYAPKPHVRYLGLFAVNAGAAGTILGVLACSANNVVSHSKRSVTTAVVVSFGGVGGIIASTVFRQQDSPHYIPGLWVTMGWQFLMLALLGITTLHFRRLNKKYSKGNLESPFGGHPGIKYTL